MLNIKGKKSEGYSSVNEINNFHNRLRYKNIYYCLSKDSTNTERNGITINKNNKKYYMLKDKWNKVINKYSPYNSSSYIYFTYGNYYEDRLTREYLPEEDQYIDFEGLVSIRDFLIMPKLKETPLGFKNYEQIYCMRGFYYECNSLEKYHPIDLTNVNDVSYFFCGNIKLTNNELMEINVPNANDFENMFSRCLELTEINLLNFATKVTDKINAYAMFFNCNKLTKITGLQNFQLIRDMSGMFDSCSSLTFLSNKEIDMTSCTNCANMFNNCPLTDIVLKNVPTDLNLSSLGTTNYTVINYI